MSALPIPADACMTEPFGNQRLALLNKMQEVSARGSFALRCVGSLRDVAFTLERGGFAQRWGGQSDFWSITPTGSRFLARYCTVNPTRQFPGASSSQMPTRAGNDGGRVAHAASSVTTAPAKQDAAA